MSYLVSDSTCIRPNPEVIVGRVGDEIVMMNMERGNYYGLNASASRIWQFIEKDISVATICAQLQREYNVTPDVCGREVCHFVSQMIDEGLVLVKDGSASMASMK